MRTTKSWIMYLPYGLREQASWVFIGVMISLVGLSFLTGFNESSIAVALGQTAASLWGVFLTITGAMVAVTTVRGLPASEKLSLRWLSISLLTYMGWLLIVVDFRRALMTIMFGVVLCFMAEIRIAYLKQLLKKAPLKSNG